MRRLRYSEKGFTLLEILIVLLMLSVIAAIVVPNAATFLRSGKKGAAELELGSVQVAVYAMMADKGIGSLTAVQTYGPDDSGDYPIGTDPDNYLQGGIDRLKGTWTVGETGLVTGGSYPVDPPHWVYTAAPTPTWSYPTP